MKRVAAFVAGSLLLGGCVFKQSRHARTFVLDAIVPPATLAASEPPGPVLGVLKVTVPGWLDRPQITGRGTDGQVVADEYARWGEPVAKGIQRVVAENLAALLPERRVATAPFAPSVPVEERLELTVVEAARQTDGSVLWIARWALLARNGEPLAQGRSSHASRPTALGAVGAVSGSNEALAALSREIAQVVRSLPAPPPTPAP